MTKPIVRCVACDAPIVLWQDGSTRCLHCDRPVGRRAPVKAWRFVQQAADPVGRVITEDRA